VNDVVNSHTSATAIGLLGQCELSDVGGVIRRWSKGVKTSDDAIFCGFFTPDGIDLPDFRLKSPATGVLGGA